MILRVSQASAKPSAAAKALLGNVRTVFLDRDGVINRKAPEGEYVSRWDQFHPLPGIAEAIAELNRSGRLVFVVTNQRGVALGLYTEDDVRAVHTQLQQWLVERGARVDGFYYCPHDKHACSCRKPLPGLFEQAFAAHPGLTAETSLMIGDSLSDIEAGKALRMPTIFIAGDPAHQKAGADRAAASADYTAASLAEAVALLSTARR